MLIEKPIASITTLKFSQMCGIYSQRHNKANYTTITYIGTHTHTHTHIYIYIYVCVCVCVRVCVERETNAGILQLWHSVFLRRMYVNTYLLTYSMVQSPSWEANWFAASQEIPRISRNPKVHYRTYKRPPIVSILGQPNPVHIPTSHLLEIHPNIIHTSTPRSTQCSIFKTTLIFARIEWEK